MHPYFYLKILGIDFIIPAYSLFACIGLFFFMLLTYNRIDYLKISFKKFMILILFIVIGVGIGSKALFILTKTQDIIENFSLSYLIKTIITSGFVFYGGLFGALLGTWVYCIIFKMKFSIISNILTPAFPLFHTFGRIGCFFAGCCYGKKASWGYSLANEPDTLRLPIPLFESGCLIVITLLLILIEKKTGGKAKLLPIYLSMYAICRFILEFYRGDEIRGFLFGLSTSQWVSVIILVSVLLWKLYQKFNMQSKNVLSSK